jgi:type IV secretory pathway VirB10-like protein
MPNKSKNSLLYTELPKLMQLNKPLVIIAISIIVFVLLFAVISSFNTTKLTKKPNKNATLSSPQNIELSPMLNSLPENYQDIANIKKFNSHGQDTNLETLQKELDSLKAEHELLEKQLTMLSKDKSNALSDNMPAKNSSLFFGNLGPEQENTLLGNKSSTDNSPPTNTSSPFASNSTSHNQNTVVPLTKTQSTYFKQQAFNSHKLAVAKATDSAEDIYDLHNVVTPVSPYEIQAGTIIPAILITGINTTLTGTVVAQTQQNMYDSITGNFLLVPKGSKILGDYDYRLSYGQRRVLITFNRIIRPDGSSILLGKPTGADLQGQAGMEGDVNNHWGRVLGAATLSTILSIGAGVVSDNTGNNGYYQNARQGAALGAASGINQAGQSIVNRSLDIQPTITIPAGFKFNIIVKKDMVLTPYKPRN